MNTVAIVFIIIVVFYLGFKWSGHIADKYLSEAMALLADSFRMSPSMAAITLLAIGNGANDIFTSIA